MLPRLALPALVAAASLCAPPAAAQEISLTGPLRGACIARRDTFSVPAPIESLYWVSGGVVTDGAVSPLAAAGAELTTGVYESRGQPGQEPEAGTKPYRRRVTEVRLGPWAQTAIRNADGLLEGGATVHVGAVDDRITRAGSLYQVDLRVGGGWGAFAAGRSPFFSVAIAWGLRTVFDRHTVGLPCDPEPDPPLVADATAIRLVLTARHATDFAATEVGVAIEVSPSAIFLPWRVHETRERRASRANDRPD